MSYEPTRPMPTGWNSRDYPAAGQRPRRRRRRWPLVTGIILVIVVVLLVVADRVACAIAENQMATQVQQSGFPTKPHVTIEGFPFLTQLAGHDFNDVVVTASNVVEGPVEIASLQATLHGMHINGSFSGATITTINGSALITFTALANAGGIPQGITLGPNGSSPDQVKANIDLGIISGSVIAQVNRLSTDEFNVQVVQAGDIPTSLLGSLASFNVKVPQLPAGVAIQSVTVTQQGVLVTITGHNTTLSE
jgi:LmeA-like phospholipid-binding